MKEHGLLLTGELVPLTLAGEKWMTRRVVTRFNSLVDGYRWSEEAWGTLDLENAWTDLLWGVTPGLKARRKPPYDTVHRIYPIYEPEHLLWFRETWAVHREWDSRPPRSLLKSLYLWYRATDNGRHAEMRGKWRPSIFMPRWASRIVRPITAPVRPEHVQDISLKDIEAEGVRVPTEAGHLLLEHSGPFAPANYLEHGFGIEELARAHFASLWDQLNAKRGFPWASNPWVWPIEYERMEV